MSTVRLLAYPGSARRESFNRRLLGVMIGGAQAAGAEVTAIDPNDYEMPLYNGDLEANTGLPTAARELQQLFASHDGFLLASPEYNGFPTPLLKNTLDWVSCPLHDGSGRFGTAFMEGKPAGIASASPGALGGIRSLALTRQYLSNLGFLVVPGQVGVSAAKDAFDHDGRLRDPRLQQSVEAIGAAVAKLAAALKRAQAGR